MNGRIKLGAVAVAAVIAIAAAPALAENLKFGSVDVQKVLDNSIVGQQASKKLKDLGEKYATDLKGSKAKLDALAAEIDKNSLLWNEQTRKDKEEERRRMERDLSRTAKDYDEDFKAKQREYLETISREIQKTIEEIGAAEKYQLIFDSRSRNVIYFSPDTAPLTDKVIKAYDAKKR